MATNNDGTAHDPALHPLAGVLDKHGFSHSETASVPVPGDGGQATDHHLFNRADHVVATPVANTSWASTPPGGKYHTGTGAAELNKHLMATKPKNEDIDADVETKLNAVFDVDGELTPSTKKRMTALFVETAAQYAAEAIQDLVQMTNESVERMEQVVAFTEQYTAIPMAKVPMRSWSGSARK